MKLFKSLLLCLMVLVVSCKKNNVHFNHKLQVFKDEAFKLENDLSIKLNTINDSRCPKNALCIWAGNVVVNLSLLKNDKEAVQQDLCLGCDPNSDTKIFNVDGKNYQIQLLEVNPYPESGKSNDNTKASVIIIVKE